MRFFNSVAAVLMMAAFPVLASGATKTHAHRGAPPPAPNTQSDNQTKPKTDAAQPATPVAEPTPPAPAPVAIKPPPPKPAVTQSKPSTPSATDLLLNRPIDFSRVKLGMTRADVVAALGEPNMKSDKTWFYNKGGFVRFTNDIVSDVEAR